MNNTILIFSDEAGQFQEEPSNKSIKSNPFYIRSAIYISTEDYINFQSNINKLKTKFKIPNDQEIKWSDIYAKEKGRLRHGFLEKYSCSDIKNFISQYLKYATQYNSIKFLFTITKNNSSNNASANHISFFHLQNIYQRAQLDAQNNKKDFYSVIIDDLNKEILNELRKRCSDLLHNGDQFIRYNNLNQSLLVEKSEQSVGIQLADYVAGIFNSVAKRYILGQENYNYANSLYLSYIAPHIRNYYKKILGYGIIKITNNNKIENLSALLEVTSKCL